LPSFDSIPRFHAQSEKSSSQKDERRKHLYPSDREKRIYDKLKRAWEDTEWVGFVPVKISSIIFSFAVHRALFSKKKNEILEQIRQIATKHKAELKNLRYLRDPKTKLKEDTSLKFLKAYELCQNIYNDFSFLYNTNKGDLIKIMQDFGDEIRKHGLVSPNKSWEASPENILVLPEAIRRVIKAHRLVNGASHFVIDAFRNPYEIEFFKRRYSEFYLIGVLRNASKRHSSLFNNGLKNDDIRFIDEREKGKLVERKKENISDWVISQDLNECIDKSDVFIDNEEDCTGVYPQLKYNIIKLITLIKNPGCIPPNSDERNMQIAMTAKQMSGCISRQVGAVVVNGKGYAVGIGWNDPPRGQVPCSLRTGKELAEGGRKRVFSDYERSPEFINHIKTHFNISHAFCFRNMVEKVQGKSRDKMREFTRALHAEENALLQAAKGSHESLDGATLYTTSKTCTLCAKKAYQLGIDKIVYIEEYPGIAIDQTIKTGDRDIEIKRFQGITGAAYFSLYSSLLPERDIIQLYS
jgi:dCMP deaminase